MKRKRWGLLVAVLAVLAGCSAPPSGSPASDTTRIPPTGGDATAGLDTGSRETDQSGHTGSDTAAFSADSRPSGTGSASGTSGSVAAGRPPATTTAAAGPSGGGETDYAGIQTVAARTRLMHGLVTGRMYKELEKDPGSFFDQWLAMNLSWIRIEFEEYMGANGRDPQAQETRYKTIVNEAHKRGIRVLGIVSVNSMKDKTAFPNSAASRQTYVQAAERCIKAYGVDAIEICNEPLGFLFGGKNDNLANYGRLMVDTYTALKSRYPKVLFVAPVTCNAEQGEWLGRDWQTQQVPDPEKSIFNCAVMQEYRNKNNGKLPLDVISWHPYGSENADPLSNQFYFGRNFDVFYKEILDYKDIAGRPIVGDYPIWFTEYGWDTKKCSADQQDAYYNNMMTAVAKYPQIQAVFLYTWRDDGSSGSESYGVLTATGARKPLYYSLLAAASQTGLYEGKALKGLIDAYLDAGGAGRLGAPAAPVNRTGTLLWQVFRDRNQKPSAILADAGNPGKVKVLTADYGTYFDSGGKLKAGVSSPF